MARCSSLATLIFNLIAETHFILMLHLQWGMFYKLYHVIKFFSFKLVRVEFEIALNYQCSIGILSLLTDLAT